MITPGSEEIAHCDLPSATAFPAASRPVVRLQIEQKAASRKEQLASLPLGDVILRAGGKFFSSCDDSFNSLGKGGFVQLEFLCGGKPVLREVALLIGPIANGGLRQ